MDIYRNIYNNLDYSLYYASEAPKFTAGSITAVPYLQNGPAVKNISYGEAVTDYVSISPEAKRMYINSALDAANKF